MVFSHSPLLRVSLFTNQPTDGGSPMMDHRMRVSCLGIGRYYYDKKIKVHPPMISTCQPGQPWPTCNQHPKTKGLTTRCASIPRPRYSLLQCSLLRGVMPYPYTMQYVHLQISPPSKRHRGDSRTTRTASSSSTRSASTARRARTLPPTYLQGRPLMGITSFAPSRMPRMLPSWTELGRRCRRVPSRPSAWRTRRG